MSIFLNCVNKTDLEYITSLYKIWELSNFDMIITLCISMHTLFQIMNYLLNWFTLNYPVIWICLERGLLVQAFLRALELGMTGDDYAWFLYVRHPDDRLPDKAPWLQRSAVEIQQGVELNLTEEVVAYRRKAFYGLKMVRLCQWHWQNMPNRICICPYREYQIKQIWSFVIL